MRGNIRQINDYYPYGLTWSRPEGDDARMYQNKQWQQNEWGEGNGLEMYDFHVQKLLAAVQRRLRDSHPAAQPCGTKMGVYPGEGRNPVLARWHAPDPMNQFDSPYNAMLRSSWSKQSGDLEIRIPQLYFAGGNNPVVNIDPDGMQVPWEPILSALGSFVIKAGTTTTIKMVEHAFTYGVEMVSEKTTSTSSFAKSLNGILQLASAMLAWGEGSKILREGQYNGGAQALSNYEIPIQCNNPDQGFQIHYNDNGTYRTVSITNLSDQELNMAIIKSGGDPFVIDVVNSFKYLREADLKNRNILGRMAKSKRTTDIWQTKQQAFYKMKTTDSDIDSQKGVHWSPTKGYIVDSVNLLYQTPAMGLYFEIGHVFMRSTNPILFWILNFLPTSYRFVDGQERRNLRRHEIPVARAIPGEVVRTDQTGEGIELSGPTSHKP